MGFTIIEPLALESLGISLPNLYATFRGCLSIIKNCRYNIQDPSEKQEKYNIQGQLSIFIQQDPSTRNLSPLKQQNVSILVDIFPSDPMTLLYTKAKELFPSKTFIDV